jgi:Fe/S biogenesis protein NfuA
MPCVRLLANAAQCAGTFSLTPQLMQVMQAGRCPTVAVLRVPLRDGRPVAPLAREGAALEPGDDHRRTRNPPTPMITRYSAQAATVRSGRGHPGRRLAAMATSTEDLQATAPTGPVVTLTPEALQVVRDALDQEPDPASLALWLEVRGVQGDSFVYDLYFQATSDADDGDVRHAQGDIEVIVPAGSVDRIRGARLEWAEEGGGGLVLVNPNAPTPEEAAPNVPAEVLAKGIDGVLARRVVAVLEQSVNPAIASHGGRADLVALNEEDGTAYLRLSGGCQGCAMSQMTLRQGIETALLEEVPELTRILDVTDHGSGENPFYS